MASRIAQTTLSLPAALRYAMAAVSVAAATLVALWLRPYSYATPFLFFYPAVIVAVWLGGFRPGLFATLLASLAANRFLLVPYDRFSLDAPNIVRTVFFCATFASICWLAELARRQLRQSEKRWETTLRSIGDAVISTDPAGHVVFMNQVAEELTDWTLAEAQGKSLDQVFAIINETNRQRPESPVVKVIHSNKAVGLANHTLLVRRDGVEIPIDDSGAPMFGAKGRLTGVVLVFRDITARRQAEAELTAVYENAPVIMLLVDGEHRIRKANKLAGVFAGASAGDPGGQRDGDALGCLRALDDPRGCGFGPYCPDCALRTTVLDTLTTGVDHQQVEASLPFRVSGRAEVLTPLISTNRLSVQGEGQVLVAIQDITRRKHAEAAMMRAEKLAAAGRLAATMAHEINNPLEAMTNLAYLLSQSLTGTTLQSSVELLQQQLQTIAHITSQTLKFHRDSGQPAEFSLSRLIGELTQFYEPKTRSQGITLDLRLDSAATLVGFVSEIRQVIANLLLNAIEATPGGGRIVVHLYETPDWRSAGRRGFRISIADNGSGIDPLHYSRLFEPFFTTKGENGTGLGLWVSSGIVNRAGGFVRVWSSRRSGHSGTCFSIFLPAEGPIPEAAGRRRYEAGEGSV